MVTIILLLFLTLQINNIIITNSLNVIKSNIYEKNSISVLGVEYNYAIGDIEFNDDLYYLDSWVSCPKFKCNLNTTLANNCTCDYTDKSNCPKSAGGSSCPSCSTDIVWCDSDWITLTKLDEYSNFTINQTTQFRYKAKGNTCMGLSLKFNSIEGYGTIEVGTGNKSSIRSTSAQRNPLFSFCPTVGVSELWTMDTYFIEITPITNIYSFSIILHDIEIDNNIPQVNDKCKSTDYNLNIICINQDEVLYPNGGLGKYSFDVKVPNYYYFYAPTYQTFTKVSYYISKNENNKIPTSDNCDWQVIGEGDNDFVLYLEPINETQPLRIYINFSNKPYLFSINSNGKNYLKTISSSSIQSSYLSLIGSSKLVLHNQNQYFTPSIYSDPTEISFSPLSPTEYLNPIFPPSKLFISNSLKISLKVPLFNSIKSNSYQFSFLLSKTSFNQYFKYQEFETIQNSTLVIDSTLYDRYGMPIKLNITFNKNNNSLDCNVEEFNSINQLINEIKEKLLKVDDIDETTSLRYSLDYLQTTDLWMKCKYKFSSYFNSKLSYETKRVKSCLYSPSDPEYENDPCCSSTKEYYQCCNPTSINITVINSTNINSGIVKDQCSSYDCTASVLDEYQKTLSKLDLCTVSDYSITSIGYSVTRIVRDCKSVLNSPFCTNDSDCSNYGSANKCNLYTRHCIPDFESVDKMYINCVLSNLPIGTLFYLTNSTSFNDTTINQIYNSYLSSDCVSSLSIMDRSTFSYDSPEETFNRCAKNYGCLDSTCLLHFDICFDVINLDYRLNLQSKVENCTNYGFCKGLPCTDCKYECLSIESFCGYCSDENLTQCHSLNNIKNQTECENHDSICILPDGSIITGITESECTETYGQCSHNNCGEVECSTVIDGHDSGCFGKYDEQSCLNLGGIYSAIGDICRVPITQDDCSTPNLEWVDCGNKPFGGCYHNLLNSLICTEKYSRNCNKTECESIAGECSDSYYFTLDANPYYPNGLGKCVQNHTYDSKSKSCLLYENDSPEGCFKWQLDYTTPTTKESCESKEGYRWWTRSITRDQCLSKVGCKTMLNPNYSPVLPYNFKFNEMSQEQCQGCEDSFNEYTNKYSWTNATWIPGVFKEPSWIKNQFISNQIQNTFNYQLFYNSIEKSVSYQYIESYRTESLCRIERVQKSLESLVCSCVDDGYQVFSSYSDEISQCFQSSVPSIGQIRVCTGEENEFIFDYVKIGFDNNAINQTCQTFTIGQISKQIYTSTVRQSLASNFVSYKKPPSYAVLNSNDATIGFISSDGIMIQSQEGINRVTICFEKSKLGEYDIDYPILDIAIQVNNQSLPVPLELTNENINNTDSTYICSNIINTPKGNPIYFQIYRASDSSWKTKSKELFDKEAKVLIYILAGIFLAITLFGIYEIVTIIIFYYKKIIVSFHLIQSLIIIVTLFILIRAIYFFLLTNGSLQNQPVLDYILVVLPTFIYFTAFSTLIILWYTIVFLVLKNNTGTGIAKKLYKIIIIVNIILYIFFVCIVLVFQYTSYKANNDCGSRIFISNQTSKPQKAVSLTYAIVQAVLSLIISAAFVYLGRSLYNTISTNKKNLSNTKHQKKIFILSAICSVGFLLHCIFVLVLVTNISSMTFSFCGLIITEIIPVASILYCFNPNDQNNNNKKVSKGIKITNKVGKSKIVDQVSNN